MKKKLQDMETYEAPRVEVIEVEVERGFAGSTLSVGGGMGENTDIGGNGDVMIGF